LSPDFFDAVVGVDKAQLYPYHSVVVLLPYTLGPAGVVTVDRVVGVMVPTLLLADEPVTGAAGVLPVLVSDDEEGADGPYELERADDVKPDVVSGLTGVLLVAVSDETDVEGIYGVETANDVEFDVAEEVTGLTEELLVAMSEEKGADGLYVEELEVGDTADEEKAAVTGLAGVLLVYVFDEIGAEEVSELTMANELDADELGMYCELVSAADEMDSLGVMALPIVDEADVISDV